MTIIRLRYSNTHMYCIKSKILLNKPNDSCCVGVGVTDHPWKGLPSECGGGAAAVKVGQLSN